jgi:hypothetical protein
MNTAKSARQRAFKLYDKGLRPAQVVQEVEISQQTEDNIDKTIE